MTPPRLTLLADRGVVCVTGADAGKLLQGVISNDVGVLDRAPALHAGLLSPQGKILFEFFVVRSGDGFLLETRRELAEGLVKRLCMYRLRAKAEIGDRSADYRVLVAWGATDNLPRDVLCYRDPRLGELGVRALAPADGDVGLAGTPAATEAWHQHRIGLGVPESVRDYPLGDTFPHEADFDLLNGVSFTKGCFIGQEVVSRMHNRATVKRRVVPIEANAALAPGAAITAGKAAIGAVGSVAGRLALAMLRLDRAAEARAKGEALFADGAEIRLRAPAWAPQGLLADAARPRP
jgi:folate-binding protein YgfZ